MTANSECRRTDRRAVALAWLASPGLRTSRDLRPNEGTWIG